MAAIVPLTAIVALWIYVLITEPFVALVALPVFVALFYQVVFGLLGMLFVKLGWWEYNRWD